LIWPKQYHARLQDWVNLRSASNPNLQDINSWWFRTPWTAYYLHWDDKATWPDPWQLLDDNIFCDLARGLGIIYTLAMLDRPEFLDSELVETDLGNLVLVEQRKYILNYQPEVLLNTNLEYRSIGKRITIQEVQQRIK
jgi:hypothetical protein